MENHFNCIYCYTNKVDGKKYVGQAADFNKRHKQHIRQAYNENCKAYNHYFHKAIRKYGIENFEIEILIENLQNQEELDYWEKFYIVEFDTLAKNQKGYNIGEGGYGNPLKGKSDEEMKEIRRKQSKSGKGKNKGKNPYVGKTEEEVAEIRKKWHETMNNKTDEELAEIGRKISEANKGENHPMYGKHHSEETRAKISEANKGKNNGNARKVVLVDPLTRLPVFIWQYKQQATEFYGISGNTLTRYLKGKAKSCHLYNGFLFYYLDEWEQLTN